jgi:hypothetical protein
MLIEGRVIRGHGVASGRAGDERFPAGTLGLQLPIFESLGLKLDGFYHGTINVSLAPLVPQPQQPLVTFRDVQWHPGCAAEDFSFFDIRVAGPDRLPVSAYIYWPHPETKPEHFQDPHVVEVLAPHLEDVSEGLPAWLWVDPSRMIFKDE